MLKPSINWLFAFVPLTFILEKTPLNTSSLFQPILFFSAALAIVPIAHLLVESTEHLAKHTGEAVGGLLNATFGNAPELIISLVALRAGYLHMVKASLIGAILANLLLAQGVAFVYGGLKYHDQTYNAGAARMYSTMMLIAVVSLAIPSAFAHLTGPSGAHHLALLNVEVSVLLLLTYVLYLVFMLKTHPNYFAAQDAGVTTASEPDHGTWSVKRAAGTLVGTSALAALMSEVLVGAAEGTGRALGMSEMFIGLICLAVIGGAAESASAIAVAGRNRMDLCVGIAIGSSIQIALFVAPALVLLSYFIAPEPLILSFNGIGIAFLFLSVLVGAMVSGDGRANWYKGVQLIVVYVMLAIMVYLAPQ